MRCASATDLPLQCDVNEAWTLDEALEYLPQMTLEYCEQPLPAGDPGGHELKRRAPVPIYVDEDCHTLADVAPCAERAHGINIKLAKSGGIREAVRMAHAARALGLGVMLGCMVESGLGIAPGAHIASLMRPRRPRREPAARATTRGPVSTFADGVQLPADAPGLGVAARVGSLILAEGHSGDPHYGKTARGVMRYRPETGRRDARLDARGRDRGRLPGRRSRSTRRSPFEPTTALVGVATHGRPVPARLARPAEGLHRGRARRRERPARVHLGRPRAGRARARATASSCATCASRRPA